MVLKRALFLSLALIIEILDPDQGCPTTLHVILRAPIWWYLEQDGLFILLWVIGSLFHNLLLEASKYEALTLQLAESILQFCILLCHLCLLDFRFWGIILLYLLLLLGRIGGTLLLLLLKQAQR